MNNVKKSIGWADFSINPVKGLCPVACSFCYARRMYKRFKWDTTVRYDPSVFLTLGDEAGSKVFVGSTHELFLPQYESWTKDILHICSKWDDRTFIFLTKRPENLAQWSPFPKNCWVGVSVTNAKEAYERISYLTAIQAKKKFVSFEPLLDYTRPDLRKVDWVIIGQQTPISKATMPKLAWIIEIIERADNQGIPVFLKNNLFSLVNYESPDTECAFTERNHYRQELPGRY